MRRMTPFHSWLPALLASVVLVPVIAHTQAAPAKPLRIIAFGAHPDDCDIRAGGTAAKYAALGHRVRRGTVVHDFGVGQMILRLGDALVGGSDGRGDGYAASL